MNYSQEREVLKKKIGKLETYLLAIFDEFPEYIQLKNQNRLVRFVWEKYGDVSCESITRVARKIRAKGHYDTTDNQRIRANHEVVYREMF